MGKKPKRIPRTTLTTKERATIVKMLADEIHPTVINEQTGVSLSMIYKIKRESKAQEGGAK